MSGDCYAGWLYVDKEEVNKLKDMGVTGPMIWRPDDGNIAKAVGKTGIVERCLCNSKVLQQLNDEYREWWKANYPYYDDSPDEYPERHFSPYSYKRAREEWGWIE